MKSSGYCLLYTSKRRSIEMLAICQKDKEGKKVVKGKHVGSLDMHVAGLLHLKNFNFFNLFLYTTEKITWNVRFVGDIEYNEMEEFE